MARGLRSDYIDPCELIEEFHEPWTLTFSRLLTEFAFCAGGNAKLLQLWNPRHPIHQTHPLKGLIIEMTHTFMTKLNLARIRFFTRANFLVSCCKTILCFVAQSPDEQTANLSLRIIRLGLLLSFALFFLVFGSSWSSRCKALYSPINFLRFALYAVLIVTTLLQLGIADNLNWGCTILMPCRNVFWISV